MISRANPKIDEEALMPTMPNLDALFSAAANRQEIPGVVAVAANDSEIIYEGAFGKRDLGKPNPMTVDSVFWIASMTKAVTTAGAMQLVEQGKLQLDEPIGPLIPELASLRVLDGFDESGAPKLRPAKNQITLRQLMTHTSGFCYDMWNARMSPASRARAGNTASALISSAKPSRRQAASGSMRTCAITFSRRSA